MEEALIETTEAAIDIPSLVNGDNIDIDKVIRILKMGRKTTLPNIDELKAQYDPSKHKIFDEGFRPNKTVKVPKSKIIGTFQTIKGNITKKDEDDTDTKIVQVNRLAFPLQKRIVNSSVSFTFGFPVEIVSNPEQDDEKMVLTAIKRINYENKISSFNRSMSRDLFRATEVAEYWYNSGTVDGEKHSNYGFDTPYKIKVAKFSPWDGHELYPFFNEYGDLVAFSRQFEHTDLNARRSVYFEVYTADVKILWKQTTDGWQQVGKKLPNAIKKIPIVYGYQDQPEWADVQWSIERLELLLSNFAEINDYHAAPKIYVEGALKGFAQKGEAGGLLQGEKDSKAYYLSWNHAPDAVKLEIETLLRFIYGFTQTPDISFDSIKGLHQISGEALKMLFMDAHLKVQEKREIFDEYLQRRLNIQKAYIGQINTSLKQASDKLEVAPEIKPFIVNDETTRINNLVTANGNKPIVSQKTSVILSGMVTDPDKEYEQILEEEERENQHDVFETTI